MNARRFVEDHLPHACAHQICANLARQARAAGDGDAPAIEALDRSGFLGPIVEAAEGDIKLLRRLERARDVAMAETYDQSVAVAMVALTHLINALIADDLWWPCDRFAAAWDELGTATYDRVDNGRHLNAAEPVAAAAAQRAIERLRLEGYYTIPTYRHGNADHATT